MGILCNITFLERKKIPLFPTDEHAVFSAQLIWPGHPVLMLTGLQAIAWRRKMFNTQNLFLHEFFGAGSFNSVQDPTFLKANCYVKYNN